MIEQEFNFLNIVSVNFGVRLKNGAMFFVPTDAPTKEALKTIHRDTLSRFQEIETDWELHDISEDYGRPRRIYADRINEFMAQLSEIFAAGALDNIANLHDHMHEVDFYFADFRDDQQRQAVSVKRAARLKSTLKARSRMMRIVDDTLVMIEQEVLQLDAEFDLMITDAHIFILNIRATEQIAGIVERVAEAAAEKVQIIHDALQFLDLTRVKAKIGKHPRLARNAAAIAANPNLANFERLKIEEMATHHGIKFEVLENGRLRCRVSDETKLLEILDARRYQVDLRNDGGDIYRASARQKV